MLVLSIATGCNEAYPPSGVRIAVHDSLAELCDDLRGFFADVGPFTDELGRSYNQTGVAGLLADLSFSSAADDHDAFSAALSALNMQRPWGIYDPDIGYYPFLPESAGLRIAPMTTAPFTTALTAVRNALLSAARQLPGFAEVDYDMPFEEPSEPRFIEPSWDNFHSFMYHREHKLAMDMLAGMSPRETSESLFVVYLELSAELMGLSDPWDDVDDYLPFDRNKP